MSRSPMKVTRCFEGTYCLRHHARNVSQVRNKQKQAASWKCLSSCARELLHSVVGIRRSSNYFSNMECRLITTFFVVHEIRSFLGIGWGGKPRSSNFFLLGIRQKLRARVYRFGGQSRWTQTRNHCSYSNGNSAVAEDCVVWNLVTGYIFLWWTDWKLELTNRNILSWSSF
jgi:hypothetical protein